MANPTTNYSWPMPTSSDLVTDLPADFAAFGQPVDTSLKALNPETTLGDIAFRSSTSNTNTRLGIGTAGQVLAVVSGVPAWTTTTDVTPLTTKGDLFTFTTVDARIGIGANNTVLTADSAEATGMKWAAPGGSNKSFTLLSTLTLTGATTVTTSSLTACDQYIIMFMGASSVSNGSTIALRFNTDSTTKYNFSGIFGTSTSLLGNYAVDSATGSMNALYLGENTLAADTSSGGIVIFGAQGTGTKLCQINSGPDNAGGQRYLMTGLYSGSSAISSISMVSLAGNFDAGKAYIWGA
jgi:hypothetical protein